MTLIPPLLAPKLDHLGSIVPLMSFGTFEKAPPNQCFFASGGLEQVSLFFFFDAGRASLRILRS